MRRNLAYPVVAMLIGSGCNISHAPSTPAMPSTVEQAASITSTPQPTMTLNAAFPGLFNQPRSLEGVDLVYHRLIESRYSNVFGYSEATGEIIQLTQIAQSDLRAFIQPDSWSPGGDGFLVFIEQLGSPVGGDEVVSVYRIDIEAGGIEYLFDAQQKPFWPRQYRVPNLALWSPDGNRLAFGAIDTETQRGFLGIHDISTRSVEHVLDAPAGSAARFEPIGWVANGSGLLFISDMDVVMTENDAIANRSAGIYKVDINTGQVVEVYWADSGLFTAAISPTDPDLLAVQVSNPDGTGWPFTWNLELINLTTGQIDTLFDRARFDVSFAFSPDGKTLAYSSSQDEHLELCFRTIASGETTCGEDERLTPQAQLDALGWLPDSESLSVYYGAPGSRRCEDVIIVSKLAQVERVLIHTTEDPSLSPTCNIFGISWHPVRSK